MWRTRVDDFLVLHRVALQVADLLLQIAHCLRPVRIKLLNRVNSKYSQVIHKKKKTTSISNRVHNFKLMYSTEVKRTWNTFCCSVFTVIFMLSYKTYLSHPTTMKSSANLDGSEREKMVDDGRTDLRLTIAVGAVFLQEVTRSSSRVT